MTLRGSASQEWRFRIVIATFCIAGAVVALVIILILHPSHPSVEELQQVGSRLPKQADLARFDADARDRQKAYLEKKSVQEVLVRWRSVPWIEISSGNAALLNAAIRAGLLPSAEVQVSEAMRTALIDRLRAHLLARASATADEYLALVKLEGAPWIDRNHSAWRPADWASISMTGRPADRDHPETLIAADFEHAWQKDESWAFLGTGPEGIRIGFARATSDAGAQSLPAALDGLSVHEMATMWFGRGTSSLGLRSDHARLVRVLDRDGSVVVCQTLMRVKLKNDATMVWASRFFWDPGSSDWRILHMDRRSYDAPGIVY
jgi:hypothetical protein